MNAATAAVPNPARLIPLIVASALFMENLDSTVIATALPAIARSLGENPVRLSLAITCYLFSLAVFILGSILCGLSGSLPGFVMARTLQGMGGAMMTPVGRLVLVRSVEKA